MNVIPRCSKDKELADLQSAFEKHKVELANEMQIVRKMQADALLEKQKYEVEKEKALKETHRIQELASEQQLKVQFAQARIVTVENEAKATEIEKRKAIKMQEESKIAIDKANKKVSELEEKIKTSGRTTADISSKVSLLASREKALLAKAEELAKKEVELSRREAELRTQYENNVKDAESNRKKEAQLKEIAKKLKVSI